MRSLLFVGVILASALEVQQKPAVSASGTGRISGVVMAADSGLPLPGVMVTIRGSTLATQAAMTDADGRYRAEGLRAGRYVLTFSKAGFVTLEYGQRTAFSPRTPLSLREGQAVDNAHIALPRAGAIEGRVTDGMGQPLADVAVTALRPEYTPDGFTLVRSGRQATTDDRGAYRLWGLDAGDYYVRATRGSLVFADSGMPGYASPPGLAAVYFPGTADVDAAGRVPVRHRQEVTGLDIALRPVRTARVRGTVAGPASINGGTAISLVRAGPVPGPAGVAEADADGHFELARVPPGSYIVRAQTMPAEIMIEVAKTGRTDAMLRTRDVYYGVVPIDVAGEDIDGLIVRTAPGGIIQGQVVLDGRPYSPEKGVTIAPAPADATSLVATPQVLAVSPDGTFELANLFGTFVLRLSGLPSSLATAAVTHAGVDVTDTGVRVTSGATVEDVRIELAPPVTRLGGRVEGGCAAGAECDVLIFSRDDLKWTLPQSRYVRRTRTVEGRFEIAGLPEGSYVAVALPAIDRNRERDPAFLRQQAASPLAVPVTLGAGRPEAVDLRIAR
jgi:hypothetical protein